MDMLTKLEFDSEDRLLCWVACLVRRTLRKYPSVCSEFEDCYSIALLALCEAMRRYSPARHDTFKSYCALRIRGSIIDAVRREGCKKNQACSNIVFEAAQDSDDRLVSKIPSPELQVAQHQVQRLLAAQVNLLSPTERKVLLDWYIHEKSQQEIAESFGMKTRSFTSKVLKKTYHTLKNGLGEQGESLAA